VAATVAQHDAQARRGCAGQDQQVLDLLADADELDGDTWPRRARVRQHAPRSVRRAAHGARAGGQTELINDGHDDASLGRAIELREHDAGHADGLAEAARLVHDILPLRRVDHQEHLRR
jgi:hypothetical protein